MSKPALAFGSSTCVACHREGDIVSDLCRHCRANIDFTKWLGRKIIYTAGYAKADFGAFAARIDDMRAGVIDIRLKPWSSMVEWQGDEMRRTLGRSYRHIAELGNRNYDDRNKGIEIVSLNSGIDQVLMLDQPVVLLCGCLRFRDCHRRVISDAITERGCFVQEWNLEAEAHFPQRRLRAVPTGAVSA